MTVKRETECEDECFSAENLLWAMAPHEEVLKAFDRYTMGSLPRTTVKTQNSFAHLVQSAWEDECGPSKTYLRKLVHRFVRSIEQEVEDDDLVQLIHECLTTGNRCDAPCANESCHLSFPLSKHIMGENKMNTFGDIRIRIFPQHNDVSLKLWEAGACLAEYFIAFPHLIFGKSIVELGSGVGLTGIIAAGCNAREVHFTDYSEAWQSNINYNINLNKRWIQQARRDNGNLPLITQGYLDWEECASGDGCCCCNSRIFDSADVLLAADVAYDVTIISSLVATLRRFLSTPSSNGRGPKVCYLAVTLRNKATYDILERDLFAKGISCRYEPLEVIDKLPNVFPVYFVQRRREVRICILTLSPSK